MAKPRIDERVTEVENTEVIKSIVKGGIRVRQGDIPTDFDALGFTGVWDPSHSSFTIYGPTKNAMNEFIRSSWSASATNVYAVNFENSPTIMGDVTLIANTLSFIGITLNASARTATVIYRLEGNEQPIVSTPKPFVNGTNIIETTFNNGMSCRVVFSWFNDYKSSAISSIIVYPTATGYVAPNGEDFKYSVEAPHALSITTETVDGQNQKTELLDFELYSGIFNSIDQVTEEMHEGATIFIRN